MENKEWDFFSVIGALACLFLIVAVFYIQIQKSNCRDKGYASADIDGCKDLIIPRLKQ